MELTATESERVLAAVGRGVIEGAFKIPDVLSHAPDGGGLSELACGTGLPKATTHRLLEQLVKARRSSGTATATT